MQLRYGFHICYVYLFYFIFIDTGANGFNGSGYLKCQGTQKPSSNMGSKSASTASMVVIIVGIVVVFG